MHPQVAIKVKKLYQNVQLPNYQTSGASGADVFAYLSEPFEIQPMCNGLIPTGLSFEIPAGYEMQVRPRSGLALKQQIFVTNSPGTIDADYRGELKIILFNGNLDKVIKINPNERIAQIVICPVVQANFVNSELSETDRSSGGFGSTGI